MSVMRSTRFVLQAIFAEVLAGAAACAAAASCGGATVPNTTGGLDGGAGDGRITEQGFASACVNGDLVPTLSGVQATPPIDYLSERFESWVAPGSIDAGPEGGDGWSVYVGEHAGTACATAVDMATCQQKLSSLRLLPTDPNACDALMGGGIVRGCFERYWAYTRGDTVGTKALIGSVDTLGEALILVRLATYSLECADTDAPPQARQLADGFEIIALDDQNCAPQKFRVHVKVSFDGSVTELSRELLDAMPVCAIAGRRPAGVAVRSGGETAATRWLSEMAALEAASVASFRRTSRELRAHGAPRTLVRRTRQAARDEVRHARSMRRQAARYGGTTHAPRIPPFLPRSLVELAAENMQEGCVRETFGALVAHWQAERAADPSVREAMRAIASDETEHAALSWDIARWIEPQLSREERALVHAAKRDAVRGLFDIVRATVAPELLSPLGLPNCRVAQALLRGLRPRLFWSPDAADCLERLPARAERARGRGIRLRRRVHQIVERARRAAHCSAL